MLSQGSKQRSQMIIFKMRIDLNSFINKYRVDEVKRLITDSKNNNVTILSLACEAGFPSISSVHTVFKKFTGLTLTEYKNNL